MFTTRIANLYGRTYYEVINAQGKVFANRATEFEARGYAAWLTGLASLFPLYIK